MDNSDNSSSTSVQSVINKIRYSTATRLVMLGVLFLLLQIPNLLISTVHNSRKPAGTVPTGQRNRETVPSAANSNSDATYDRPNAR